MNNRCIFFSGGKSSFAIADYVKTHFPEDNIVLYFTDTLWEDEDLYRFIYEAADKLELPLLMHTHGNNPLTLMFEQKLIFNSLIGECSKKLKMEVAADFLKKGKKPLLESWRNKRFLKNDDFITDATLYFGINFEELHREDSIVKNWKPFKVEMPAIYNVINNDEALKKHHIRQPALYDLGFTHNNCSGRCVKAGQKHFKTLRKSRPEVYYKLLEQEHYLKICVSAYRYITNKKVPVEEQIPDDNQEVMLAELDDAFRDYFYGRADKPKFYIHPCASATSVYMKVQEYSFMKRRNPSPVKEIRVNEEGIEYTHTKYLSEPFSLRSFEQEIKNEPEQLDMFDVGGCGCFVDF